MRIGILIVFFLVIGLKPSSNAHAIEFFWHSSDGWLDGDSFGVDDFNFTLRSSATERLIARAHELIGVPYLWGGMSEKYGFDCSGLIVYLFRSEAGVELPRTAESIRRSSGELVERSNLIPGDLVFFRRNAPRASHVGLYIGKDRFIHAPRTGKSIRIDSLEGYWNRMYVMAKRVDM